MSETRRVLLLAQPRLAILDDAIESIAPVDAGSEPAPWLWGLISGEPEPVEDRERRILELRGGGRVEVPAAMAIVEVEILAMPGLLAPVAAARGLTGVADLPEGLTLVCDPARLGPALSSLELVEAPR